MSREMHTHVGGRIGERKSISKQSCKGGGVFISVHYCPLTVQGGESVVLDWVLGAPYLISGLRER